MPLGSLHRGLDVIADAVRTKPIGVFDSGVGGLTVFRSLERDLPSESIIYLGDTARVPYGTKSAETVQRYAGACARVLVDAGIKLLVVACNTASALALESLEREFRVPVIGVIQPGVSAAVRVTRLQRIGVIGTPSTIRSGAYQRAIRAELPNAEVFAKGCGLFVPLAEEGWTEGSLVEEIIRSYLHELLDYGIDTLVLGCTHYPLLGRAIRRVVGSGVCVVDSADSTSAAVGQLLQSLGLAAPEGNSPEKRFLVTDSPERFAEVGERFLGRALEQVEWIDF